MNLSDVAIRRPVFTAMLSFVLIVLGLLSLGRLGTELYPPVNFPFLTVLTVYPGAGPEDIERDVTKPLEDAVSSISGLDDVRSFTRSDSMFMVLKFGMGTDVETATNAVRDKIGGVKGKLPDGAEDPVIQQLDIGALPVLVAVVSTPAGVNETREKVDERLRPLLEQIEGVGAVNVLGGQDREIHVNLDLDRLRALGVSPSQVAQRLGIENLSVPVGDMRLGSYAVGCARRGPV
jgi:HAE1 family hydrophobic/amphiphilic exporter-1